MGSTSTGGGRCRPESNSAPGPAHSMVGVLKNLSPGSFHYEALNTINSSTASVAEGVNSSRPQLEEHDRQPQCSCGPFLGWRFGAVKRLPGGVRTRSMKVRDEDSNPTARFIFKLFAAYGRLRESIRETNVTICDLFVGSQILCLLTASPIAPRMRSAQPSPSFCRSNCNGNLPAVVPKTASGTPEQQLNHDPRTLQSSKSMPVTRGCDSKNAAADRSLHSFRG